MNQNPNAYLPDNNQPPNAYQPGINQLRNFWQLGTDQQNSNQPQNMHGLHHVIHNFSLDATMDCDKMERLLTHSDISDTENYNPYAIPPDLEMCKMHEKCSSIGLVNKDETEEKCKCCDQVETKPYPFCSAKTSIDELRRYGFGYPLYLKMV